MRAEQIWKAKSCVHRKQKLEWPHVHDYVKNFLTTQTWSTTAKAIGGMRPWNFWLGMLIGLLGII